MATKIWAHRGASAYAPENSLYAFDLAVEMGADGVELDIYETADGRLVIHHDNDIERMTGTPAKILETDFDVLRSYNFCGDWGDKFGFVRIPELCEVLELFRDRDMTVNVELKEGSVNYLRAIDRTVTDFGMQERILYSSFDHFKLYHMKKIAPSCKTAALYSENRMFPWVSGKMLELTALHPHYSQLYRHFDLGIDYVREAHLYGLEVNVWTADKEAVLREIASWGIDHIITDYPDVAMRIIEEERKKKGTL